MASCPGVFCAEEHPTTMRPTRTNRECFSIRSPLSIGTVWNEPSLGQASYGCACGSMRGAASEPSVGMAGGSLADLNYGRWRDARVARSRGARQSVTVRGPLAQRRLGAQLPERHDHAKPEGRPRAAGHDLILADGKWHGGQAVMTPDRYPVHDGTDETAAVAHLNAVGHALDGEMVPRNVERLGIQELKVVDFHRLSFPRDGDAPNAKWQTGETDGTGGCCRRRREPV